MARTHDKYLILGYFNKGNIGDDAYVHAYRVIFPHNTLVFSSIEDLEVIPSDIKIVIVAGGDVINPYFIPKIKHIIKEWGGPCYAFSIGIPFENDANLISIFDKVSVRTKSDIPLATRFLGKTNVYFLEDVTWVLRTVVPPITFKLPSSKQGKSIAIALAQPAFYKNPNEEMLINSFVSFVYELICKYPQTKINLISFNTHIDQSESDHAVNSKLYQKLSNYENVTHCNQTALRDPIAMMKFIQKQDLVIGMRLHSVLFSMIQNIPFVAVYCTRKVENVIRDVGLEEFAYKLPMDDRCQPTSMDAQYLLDLVEKRLATPPTQYRCDLNKFALMREICEKRMLKNVLKKRPEEEQPSFEQIYQKTRQIVKQFLKMDEESMVAWEQHSLDIKKVLYQEKKNPIDIARTITFSITNKIGSPYIWGLCDNIQNKPDFDFKEAVKWIYYDFNRKHCVQNHDEEDYCPPLNVKRSIIIDMTLMDQDIYNGLHRSGWSYVISGLQQLDASVLHRQPRVIVDASLERTFLWGLNVAKTQNIVPYTRPWTGFVHHTFESSYSEYNCHALLKTPEFLESLSHCKALFVLSYYLMYQLKEALKAIGHPMVSVYALTHPTEFVNNVFTMNRFIDNTQRKIIQIGAWMRNPFSIQALPLPFDNKLHLAKCVLKGKEMDNYFKPAGFHEKIVDLCKSAYKTPSYSFTEDDENVPCKYPICRPTSTTNSQKFTNKYIQSMLEFVKTAEDSVSVLEYIDNDEYDDLLSKNIVFLNMIDVSASNTVIECIVRNTPLIVNLHPALVEVLGPNYPGFYNNLFEATQLATNIHAIASMNEYMQNMDKTKFTLDHFLTEFQSKLVESM
jgi:polysaccharide pyruvyl transferase WcaK-like protein